jgi:ferredoxin
MHALSRRHGWLYRVVHRIEHGEGRPDDLDLLNSVTDNIMGKTICALGDAASMPVQSFIKHFRDEFAYHIEHKKCLVPVDVQRAGSGFFTASLGYEMIEIEIDGKTLQVPDGSTIMEAAQQLGAYIPHFCYHKKLSIAANCRMCLVQVEKAPKPLPACATPVTNGMKVFTHSELAVKAQKGVMEFLLINHPLDCPICDQGGECQLQDLAVGYGAVRLPLRGREARRLSTRISVRWCRQDMTRCINCTRCVRFTAEIAGFMELGQAYRGERTRRSCPSSARPSIPNSPATSSTCVRSVR